MAEFVTLTSDPFLLFSCSAGFFWLSYLMNEVSVPRIIVSGLRGGSGKTVLALSLAALLRENGWYIVPFKKGPDYIDAGWLALISGSACYNLDLFMMTPEQAVQSFLNHTFQRWGERQFSPADHLIAIIEGNRGLYDGVDHQGTYSTAELAKLLNAPVILIIDCTKASNTIAAMVLGCQQMDPEVNVGGVVLNRVATARQESVIRAAIRERCALPVLGVIPRLKQDPFPERHMGLIPFQEHVAMEESAARVADIGAKYLDLEAILKVAGGTGELRVKSQESGVQRFKIQNSKFKIQDAELIHPDSKLKIGIIRDSAFQFYYPENIEALELRGAQIMEISPLREDTLPDIDSLYIGGGFPETHAVQLANNEAFRSALLRAIHDGLPVYAECGGLMYLGRSLRIDDIDYPMTGALPVTFGLGKRPAAHGYTIVEIARKNPFFPEGLVLKGHEFHYSRVLEYEPGDTGMAFQMRRGRGIIDNKDGLCYKNVLATYTHLHAVGAPQWADGMVRCAMKFSMRKGTEAQRRRGTD